MMKEQLIKAMQRNQFLNMMYLAKSGEVTKRRIKIIKVFGDSFQAYHKLALFFMPSTNCGGLLLCRKRRCQMKTDTLYTSIIGGTMA
ncbi:hypothetical protein [Lysinibacillus sp. NPDC093688]|uniref:hypothetical protein n=1 Tax=Lysinibacillus sp. NPDC093688 TaxID=3390577 RepID=UPI003CFCEFE7